MADSTSKNGVVSLRFRNTDTIPNNHCKLQNVCKEDGFWFTEGFYACWSSHKLKYSSTPPPTGGWRNKKS